MTKNMAAGSFITLDHKGLGIKWVGFSLSKGLRARKEHVREQKEQTWANTIKLSTTATGAIFTSLYFLHNLKMGPIS
jgi:hypothetical protein